MGDFLGVLGLRAAFEGDTVMQKRGRAAGG